MRFLLSLIILLAVAATTPAQDGPLQQPPSTEPAAQESAPPESDNRPIDQRPIRRSESTAVRPDAPGETKPASFGGSFQRLLLALGIVLGLILLLRFGSRRLFPNSAAPASRAVRVLSRTTLAPRQQVLLLQVGRRVVVVAESNGQMSTLANLDDADEVAQLLGQIDAEREERATTTFGAMLGRARTEIESPEPAVEPQKRTDDPPRPGEPNADAIQSQVGGLLEQVRALSNKLKQSG
jgi:flagellar biogenesis protein FliO